MTENTILIVDDNTMNIKVLGNLLKANNYTVEFALNGQSALNWIMNNDFDLVLLDVMMPGMNGFEVADAIKKLPGKEDIPIIFLTARNDEESNLKGFKSGGVDFLTKPFNQSELLARVSTHIALRNAREELKSKNRLITESMHYARLIQNALMPEQLFSTLFPESFIIYYPKDIVSGDFYWIREKGDKIVFLMVDCTGHDISGAFMSILGITLLNEIVLSNEILQTNKIPDILRDKIKSLPRQDEGDRNEGIDISLCIYDRQSKILEYSGAHSVLYLFREKKCYEYIGDKQSVGANLKEDLFTSYTIKTENNDRIYLTSDGIKDQSGGEHGKKSGSKELKNLLSGIQDQKMSDQKDTITNFLKSWKKDSEQHNDIVLMGIEF